MVEVLSPAGDRESFYRAIGCGADAVYMGAPKFNARMKADNFTIEDMVECVRYAHLKGVKVYVTLNTLVTTGEMKDVVGVVGDMLNMGVDAFIVQDLGIVSVLKSVYPDIVLHGSTQMGVHNVRGAMVAKKMGLTRVVLSREVSLEDIKEMSDKVDIELEVFVQGALCVCFSGNCYLSSIKCSASGNRGECKQLCRLPYTASIDGHTKSGYLLSPRDICNAKYIHKLIEMGVVSFKIEGRLRRSGYVAKATESYRKIVDDYYGEKKNAYGEVETSLKGVFSRGDYIRGYFEGNDIIESTVNNHIGVEIGRVVKSSKFKDIFQIAIEPKTNSHIHSGDGLKFKVGDDYVSMGVGNVDNIGNKVVVFGKNHIPTGSIVYKAVDVQYEGKDTDYSRYRIIVLKISALVGNRFRVDAQCMGESVTLYGDVLEVAKTRAISKENIVAQFSKVDERIWKVVFEDIVLEQVFMPLSSLNDIRRKMIVYFEGIFHSPPKVAMGDMPSIVYSTTKGGNMAIVSSSQNLKSLATKYDRLILSPQKYTSKVIGDFVTQYKKYFSTTPIIKLPIIALSSDIRVLDDIIMAYKGKIALMSENIYGLSYVDDGFEVLCGSNMNITNDYTAMYLKSLGAGDLVSSSEKWCETIRGTYKIVSGNLVLMTFAHCPYKTIYNCDCASCKYSGDINISGGGNKYTIRRYRVSKCYFELVDGVRTQNRGIDGQVIDVID